MIVIYFFKLILLFFTSLTYNADYKIISIPGIKGSEINGHSWNIINKIRSRSIDEPNYLGTLPVSCYLWNQPDFGQHNCVAHLKKSLTEKSLEIDQKTILVATSQGTATATRYLVELSQNNKPMPKVLICEGYAVSFNACFEHAAQHLVPVTKYLPCKYYWLAYIMKLISWHYSPINLQPLDLLEKLPKDLPIIIVHCKEDRLTPFEGAKAAYQKLISTGHLNTYLITTTIDLTKKDPKNSNLDLGHINVLDEQKLTELSNLVDNILKGNASKSMLQADLDSDATILSHYEHKEKWIKILWHINTKCVIPIFFMYILWNQFLSK